MRLAYVYGAFILFLLALVAYSMSPFYQMSGVTKIPEGPLNIAVAIVIILLVVVFIAAQQRRSSKRG
jgi:uncharacterized membrane protein YhhN